MLEERAGLMAERRRNTTHGVLRGPGPACCHRTRPPGARTRGGRGEAAGWQRCRRTPRPPHCLCSDPWHAAVPKILAVNASGTAVNAFLPLLVCSAVSARSCLPLSACHRGCRAQRARPVARRERKTKGALADCSYPPRRSRPHTCDPTDGRGPRGGRYFIYRPPRDGK